MQRIKYQCSSLKTAATRTYTPTKIGKRYEDFAIVLSFFA